MRKSYKNDYFLEMLDQVLAWGLRPCYVSGDSWYSSAENLKTVKNHGLGLMFAVQSNRTVSVTTQPNFRQLNTIQPKRG